MKIPPHQIPRKPLTITQSGSSRTLYCYVSLVCCGNAGEGIYSAANQRHAFHMTHYVQLICYDSVNIGLFSVYTYTILSIFLPILLHLQRIKTPSESPLGNFIEGTFVMETIFYILISPWKTIFLGKGGKVENSHKDEPNPKQV